MGQKSGWSQLGSLLDLTGPNQGADELEAHLGAPGKTDIQDHLADGSKGDSEQRTELKRWMDAGQTTYHSRTDPRPAATSPGSQTTTSEAEHPRTD